MPLTHNELYKATQRVSGELFADQPRLKDMIARGTRYVWLKALEGPIADIGCGYNLIETTQYPYESQRGCVIHLAGLLLSEWRQPRRPAEA